MFKLACRVDGRQWGSRCDAVFREITSGVNCRRSIRRTRPGGWRTHVFEPVPPPSGRPILDARLLAAKVGVGDTPAHSNAPSAVSMEPYAANLRRGLHPEIP